MICRDIDYSNLNQGVVFLAGNGKTLEHIDFNKLSGHDLTVVNDFYKFAPLVIQKPKR